MNCPACNVELPDDARFCVECGTEVGAATTGPTVKLTSRPGDVACPVCRAPNPEFAAFCVNCGRSLEASAPVRPAATLERPAPPISLPDAPELPAPPRRALHPPAPPYMCRGRWHPASKQWGGVSGGLFLIGLAILFLTGSFWPGILVLVGTMALINEAAAGKVREGLSGFAFLAGLAFLFLTGSFWPGILILLGVIALISRL